MEIVFCAICIIFLYLLRNKKINKYGLVWWLCITNNSIKHQSSIYTQLNVKTGLFQTIQFSISSQFSSIWPIDRTVLNASTSSQNGPGSNGNDWVHQISQSSSITRTSPSDCLVSYQGYSLGWGVLPLGREGIVIFYISSRLAKNKHSETKILGRSKRSKPQPDFIRSGRVTTAKMLRYSSFWGWSLEFFAPL